MPNRLADTASPYLQQHAANPVDWQPWDAAALAEARRDGKPILLSVGYSACHWCHVMAHESFEDPDIARAMNANFVNIKVDREERPDLDLIYQRAHWLLTQHSGGWPLTLFLTPDGTPFFGGTYFPKEPMYGRPGFLDLLGRVAQAWREQQDGIVAQNGRLHEMLARLEPQGGVAAPANAADAALDHYLRVFDPLYGGFGGAPKFPHAAELALFEDRVLATGNPEMRNVLGVTLARMASGGIHDQLGGGFSRYSVDAEWSIPHFEKMLYDNAQLVALYARAARWLGDPAPAEVATRIVAWLAREMRAPDGALYASLDADSEGEEGKFYLWREDEARGLVSAEEWAVAAPHYGFDRAPNFEHREWNLRVRVPLVDIAVRLSITPAEAAARLASARAKLFAARSERVRPGLDDKVLTAWNALAVAGLARAAREGIDGAGAMARAALDALRATAWRDGRLHASRQHGAARHHGLLDDYAFLLDALIAVMELDFRAQDYAWAIEVADAMIARFEDAERGGFWLTSHDHEALIVRHKPGHDAATPSGNGTAALALARLAVLAGEPRYAETARRAVAIFGNDLARSPASVVTLARANEALLRPPALVIVDGARDAAAWSNAARTADPAALVIDIGGRDDVPAALVKGARVGAGTAAYVCRDFTCLPRIDTQDALTQALASER
jgi:uncharacterized protein